jgi:hypothetical protein
MGVFGGAVDPFANAVEWDGYCMKTPLFGDVGSNPFTQRRAMNRGKASHAK